MKLFRNLLLASVSLAPLGAVAQPQPDLREQHAQLLELAIREDDADQVAKLLNTPYVNPNGFEYRNGRRVIYLDNAIGAESLRAADALLAGGATPAGVAKYFQPGNVSTIEHAIRRLYDVRADKLKAINTVLLIQGLFRKGFFPETDRERVGYMTTWALLFSGGPGQSIDADTAHAMWLTHDKYKLRFTDAVKVSRWDVVFPATGIDPSRYEEIGRFVDFSQRDANEGTVLDALLMDDHPNAAAWLEAMLRPITLNRPWINSANAKSLYPADFLWLWNANQGGGQLCIYSPNLIDKPVRQRKTMALQAGYGPPANWARGSYSQCPNGRCTQCLGP